jgi:hypothetical protein
LERERGLEGGVADGQGAFAAAPVVAERGSAGGEDVEGGGLAEGEFDVRGLGEDDGGRVGGEGAADAGAEADGIEVVAARPAGEGGKADAEGVAEGEDGEIAS